MMASRSVPALSRRITCLAKSNASLRCVSALALPTHFPCASIERKDCNGSGNASQMQILQSNSRAGANSFPFISKRHFFGSKNDEPPPPSSESESEWGKEYDDLIAKRNKNIKMHPDGHGQNIMPLNYVLKKNEKTGVEKRVFLEHALGYFWGVKELNMTDNKPILSNENLIPVTEAETFPYLKELVSLNDEEVDIPDFFTRNNRSEDASAQCTLVAISCKDFGAKLLPSWTEPFDKALCRGKDADRYEIVRITMNEGWIAKLISPFISSGTKQKTAAKDYANTLLYYGCAEEMRDMLRMHNIYSGYVFLVDGIGRVRWAGSGKGSEEEVYAMIDFAKLLTQPSERVVKETRQKQSMPRVGKKLRS